MTNEEKILRLYKLKVTPARLVILKSFSNAHSHMNAEQVYKKVKKHKIDLVTVYRTLSVFEEKSVLIRVALISDSIYYERNLNDHHHIICLECKKVSDFNICNAKDLIVKALSQVKDFKSISYHSFDLFGLCKNCAKKD